MKDLWMRHGSFDAAILTPTLVGGLCVRCLRLLVSLDVECMRTDKLNHQLSFVRSRRLIERPVRRLLRLPPVDGSTSLLCREDDCLSAYANLGSLRICAIWTCSGRDATQTISSAISCPVTAISYGGGSSSLRGVRPLYSLSARSLSPRYRTTLNSVSTMPGWISATRIGVFTSSLRSTPLIEFTADLVAQ